MQSQKTTMTTKTEMAPLRTGKIKQDAEPTAVPETPRTAVYAASAVGIAAVLSATAYMLIRRN